MAEPLNFPILAHEEEIFARLRENQVIVVVGETGSGKTTQIPLFLYKAGYAGNDKRIGITQPRRIAATFVAKFVAEGLGVRIGNEVGYKIRFDDNTDNTDEGTAVKFMTDGILLREAQLDPELSQYSVIMVDEAHERSLNIDFVLGLIKDVLPRRPDIKVVVTSATINPQKFANYFGSAPIVSVSGRMFPVEIRYHSRCYPYGMNGEKVIKAVVDEVFGICANDNVDADGDVLVFMTGKDDIDATARRLQEELGDMKSGIVVLPVYGAMMPEEQQRIFRRYPNKRKVILATNIAETSLTIDGVVYVIDSGYIKQTGYNSQSGVGSLNVIEHSRAGCDQRAGRAGRTKPGVCIRLYTEENYGSRQLFTTPEILRTDLAGVVLQMIAMGIADVENFDFIDPPDKKAFHDAHKTLRALGAIDQKDNLTKIGEMMSALPLEPRIGRMLIAARERGCLEEVAIIAASLGQRPPFVMPRDNDEKWDAKRAHTEFKDAYSDFQSLLNVYDAYHSAGAERDWCVQRFIDWRVMEEIMKIEEQIVQVLLDNGFEPSSSSSREDITLAVASGLAQNLCEKTGRHNYTREGTDEAIFIHPGSGLFKGQAGMFIVCAELRTTSRCFALGCAAIEPAWLPEIVPQHCQVRPKGLARYDADKSVAVLEEEVLYKGRAMGSRERKISLRKAHELQNAQIKEALRMGYKKLTVIEGRSRFDRRAVSSDGTQYELPYFDNSEPGEYYCEIVSSEKRGLYPMTFSGRRRLYRREPYDHHQRSFSTPEVHDQAIPKVCVIDLPPLPTEPAGNIKEAKPAVANLAIQLLADKFKDARAR
ncbi:MAG: ATP-dependent RNA helicase [bacterium]|nr:ATP-dependent RNA helicase [bacterium]